MTGIEYIRQMSDDDHRAQAREQVAAAVRRGDHPDAFPAEDLAWAFDGRHDELNELRRQAVEVAEAERSKQKRIEERRQVHDETDRVLLEWDEAERRERRQRAEAEARGRLGL
ncbi:MAG: hypothetical protein JWM06_1686 [Actinomycetia bacterium]|nr:hypothetical protein [Actinomycetes bacterium]